MTEGDIAAETLEGVIDSEREYRVVFRDANAIGGLAYLDPRSGNADRMQRYRRDLATATYEFWRNYIEPDGRDE